MSESGLRSGQVAAAARVNIERRCVITSGVVCCVSHSGRWVGIDCIRRKR